MSGFDRDQLENLRRQVEEDYRLDLAAIERLQRRFAGALGALAGASIPSGSLASSNYSPATGSYAAPGNGSNGEARSTGLPPLTPSVDAQDKELSGALRSMFKSSPGR